MSGVSGTLLDGCRSQCVNFTDFATWLLEQGVEWEFPTVLCRTSHEGTTTVVQF